MKIDGKDISRVVAVRASIVANLDNYGERTGHSNPLHVTITRDCKEKAELDSFRAGIKSPNKMSALIELQDSDENTRYTLSLKSAFVADWRLRSERTGTTQVLETLELYCGDMEPKADAETKTYRLTGFYFISAAANLESGKNET
jgi:hypothetical protein